MQTFLRPILTVKIFGAIVWGLMLLAGNQLQGGSVPDGKPDASALWIDVRSEKEFQDGHVAGAVNIPHDVIGSKISDVEKGRDRVIYLYCRSGRRSGLALETLKQKGYTRLTNLGGYEQARQFHDRIKPGKSANTSTSGN